MRICKTCGVEKPLTNEHYQAHPERPGKNKAYFERVCRDCRSEYKRQQRKNPQPPSQYDSDLGGILLPTLPQFTRQECEMVPDAACRGLGRRFHEMRAVEAKKVCATCSVFNECRLLGDMVESVLTNKLVHNVSGYPVWAGETLNERLARRAAA